MKLLTKEQQELYENEKIWYICKKKKKKLKINMWKIKSCEVKYHCHYTGEYSSAEHM